MKLGYKYYRNNLIKLAILSVGCLGIFWDEFTGRGHPDSKPGALILIAVLIVVGNIGLFIAMRRAKRREQLEIAQISISNEPQRPNRALQRTRRGSHDCNRCLPCARSLSLRR